MSFVLGFVFGVAVNIVLILILLGVSKALGFTMTLRNDWRRENGGFSNVYRRPRYCCADCYYKRNFYRHYAEKVSTPKSYDISESENNQEGSYDSLLEENGEKEPCE